MQSKDLHTDARRSEKADRVAGPVRTVHEHRFTQDGKMRAGRGKEKRGGGGALPQQQRFGAGADPKDALRMSLFIKKT